MSLSDETISKFRMLLNHLHSRKLTFIFYLSALRFHCTRPDTAIDIFNFPPALHFLARFMANFSHKTFGSFNTEMEILCCFVFVVGKVGKFSPSFFLGTRETLMFFHQHKRSTGNILFLLLLPFPNRKSIFFSGGWVNLICLSRHYSVLIFLRIRRLKLHSITQN